ncbi:YetF domain-containing protein [Chryseosolibacter indicus]|uniref:DUF421 domain-containing protein n=1 Tax=Chryseosolibacter indicus TaxID=2782351 RepID=A0ABS5VN85_9BACT|nr:YetF domain-containing protein [Chryseosolibacter indicus]MBT1702305.1 DUF421 domain-containing protein [Chryseosolibacter indicus]
MEVLDFVSNLILLVAVVGLFVYIKWYSSTLSSNVRNRLQTHEIIVNILLGFIVFFVIYNKEVSLSYRYFFFILSVVMHIGSCYLMLMHINRKANVYSKSYLIFHNGKFLKGAILKNDLSEEDIIKSLRLKGVLNLREIDTIILEADGELTVIYKEKVSEQINA